MGIETDDYINPKERFAQLRAQLDSLGPTPIFTGTHEDIDYSKLSIRRQEGLAEIDALRAYLRAKSRGHV